MATYTITPNGYQTEVGFRADGTYGPIAGALIYTYAAGTLTPATTYADSTGTPNSNPIVADSAGRWVAFLAPGTAYKYLYCLPVSPIPSPTSPPSSYETADFVLGTPLTDSNSGVVTGIAGEALTAGNGVYESDGSGGKTIGRWYKWDAANTYSSSLAVAIGIVQASIASGASGSINIAGNVTGVSVVTGTTYYVGTAGALTSSAPANLRQVGIANSTTSLIITIPGIPNALVPVARGGTALASGTSGGVLAYTAAGTLASSTALTAHGVVIGGGAGAVPTSTAAGTAGQVLTSNGASADPTFQVGGGSMTLIKTGSGTDATAGAANVDTVSVSGLTAMDMLLIELTAENTSGAAQPRLQNATDTLTIVTAAGNASATASQWTWKLAASQSNTKKIVAQQLDPSGPALLYATVTFTTDWTGSWTLALGHATNSGTFAYRWRVYKIAGQ